MQEKTTHKELSHHKLTAGGIDLHYVECGNDNHSQGVVVFLHGFPEYWGTWHYQLVSLGKNYHCIAPDLPGYNLSDKPTDNDFYKVENLIAVLAEFIKKVASGQPVYLVAHDWGGAIAWPLAAFNAHLIDKLIILNAAHPSTFTREMKYNAEQRARSAYIHQLISADAEQLLSANQCQYLFEQIMAGFDEQLLTDEFKARYLSVWQQSGAINGMLQYYRAMPQLATSNSNDKKGENEGQENNHRLSPLTSLDDITIPRIFIKVPTLVLWGEADRAFVPNCLDGLAEYVHELNVVRFPHNSHWLQHEQPAAISQEIANFIKR
ncbi:alpha/beta hydrolase [Thalassotalea euphylliae]|uniref:Alpha/beta hydrolase n=2 Tax=Thalassotalea euphylliae TaxID=1655234 RepID=A0A3E0TWS8_9GAMM|nr:alpha/beta hydrolase [Thalassotalea euphylliae]